MAPKEPTRAQLSSRLTYSQNTPAFLQKLQNRIAGVADEDEDQEFEDDGSGRPPIPKRPAIPERPSNDPGSAEEDDEDEMPQVVVLKEGKHLTQREVENERKGLHSLRDPVKQHAEDAGKQNVTESTARAKAETQKNSLSFSSKAGMKTSSGGKRKAVSDLEGHGSEKGQSGEKAKKSKKAKRAPRTLLSFADDA
ncbi:hypothetical protein EW146_g3681 [Bondarzewia mesenterica]|uniref:DUF4604 domain-containing protein n=1 Tax=Bondarzewia mesenterica TaxID=1095465 RepID=A0A4V3XFD6_9AGAM|nr:hypothetical protein EW146_g3681 [Bondarzewia mesenterica]